MQTKEEQTRAIILDCWLAGFSALATVKAIEKAMQRKLTYKDYQEILLGFLALELRLKERMPG